ncbi:6-phosphogluconolactonase/glucosamine-6-phosphateisomerase/deaminase [uncultured delta proteobacterium]|uniref:6-phosphogluconolactonase/glucosamine-6-phosphate isomerase/deaminase n=1 Tax=uncultured delta proteobacterium TaxID=34034 RepID=A0A212JAN0_9DELT|nr:6-phosphogluconolactonase/glucosamine-6-phosphateisomerase/deaminase [uncultured delta proteobacterium]
MPITVYVTDDFEHMSSVGADIVKAQIAGTLKQKGEMVLGLATGNSPTGLYRHLARAANAGEVDSRRIRSFNLDEYVGLPGENAQQRVLHRESYCTFMIEHLFSRLERKFIETSVPYGTLIDQAQLAKELKAHPEDWRGEGADAGRSIVIKAAPASPYLAWIRKEVLDGYAKKIKRAGGIDLQIIGVGGRGHVAFHESGIPFKKSTVMLVKLDGNTVANAVADGHFASKKESPRYAVSMGAELVYQAKTVVLLANGERKVESVARSLLEAPTPEVPISYGQIYAANGGNLFYVVDRVAARELLGARSALKKKGVTILSPQTGRALRHEPA